MKCCCSVVAVVVVCCALDCIQVFLCPQFLFINIKKKNAPNGSLQIDNGPQTS